VLVEKIERRRGPRVDEAADKHFVKATRGAALRAESPCPFTSVKTVGEHGWGPLSSRRWWPVPIPQKQNGVLRERDPPQGSGPVQGRPGRPNLGFFAGQEGGAGRGAARPPRNLFPKLDFQSFLAAERVDVGPLSSIFSPGEGSWCAAGSGHRKTPGGPRKGVGGWGTRVSCPQTGKKEALRRPAATALKPEPQLRGPSTAQTVFAAGRGDGPLRKEGGTVKRPRAVGPGGSRALYGGTFPPR